MKLTRSQVALNRFAWFSVACVVVLVFMGAMVTTKQAGMAVPDWPLSFGSVNPHGWWEVENIFWEHSHRLMGAFVGILMIVLAFWTWRAYRGTATAKLAWIALGGVILQGILGGLRVTQVSTTLAIVHGCTAQAFLCLVLALAVLTTPGLRQATGASTGAGRAPVGLAWALFGLVYLQLIIGATMRHLHAGLAIPDFPLSLGRVIPPFLNFGISIHYAHRVGALVITVVTLVLAYRILSQERTRRAFGKLIYALLALLVAQIALGASIIWTIRAHHPTSLHVVVGAGVLGMALCLALVMSVRARQWRLEPDLAGSDNNRQVPVAPTLETAEAPR